MMKVHRLGLSTTFTGIFRARACCETSWLTAPSSVAAMTSTAPSRWLGWKRSAIHSTPGRQAKAAENSGATAFTAAPAASSTDALRWATSPPPTTRHNLLLTSIKTGKRSMLGIHRLNKDCAVALQLGIHSSDAGRIYVCVVAEGISWIAHAA